MSLKERSSFARAGFRRIQARQVRDPRPVLTELSATSRTACPDDCRELWCAVMTEAWRQAFFPNFREGAKDVAAARRWFGTRDFDIVCGLLDMDPDEVMFVFRATIAREEARKPVRRRA